MKKRLTRRKSLTRPVRTLLHCLVILLCTVAILVFTAMPVLTPEAQYRLLEHGYMVGPARILGTEAVSENGERLLIGESNNELMLYRYMAGQFSLFADHDNLSTDLVCREKHGDLTILAAGGRTPYFSSHRDFYLPIILFDDYPNAVRAEIEFSLLLDEQEDKDGICREEIAILLNSNRSNDGYFYFSIYHSAQEDQRYTTQLELIASISAGFSYNYFRPASIPVNVRLYDAANQLILEKCIYFRTIEDDFLQES